MSELACPCDVFIHPRPVENPSGLTEIAYRVGDYTTFRRALLQSRPGETELTQWVPGGAGDLATQMMEWWAYLADILTFYNERIANESYMQTAAFPETLNRVIRTIGYRPRPGIAAAGTVGALPMSATPFTLPAGFQIASKPGPGKSPQVFELSVQTTITPVTVAPVQPPPVEDLTQPTASGGTMLGPLLLKGVVTKAKPGDELLLLKKGWDGSAPGALPYCTLVTVETVSIEKDPQGQPNTRVTVTADSAPLKSLLKGLRASDYRLLKSAQSAHVWQYPADTVIDVAQVDLETITRAVKVGDPILFEILTPGGTPAPKLASVTRYLERIWFANPASASDPSKPPVAAKPTDTAPIPVPIPHTLLGFAPLLQQNFDVHRDTVAVRYAWQDVGELIPAPAPALDGTQTTLTVAPPGGVSSITDPPPLPFGDLPVMIEDANKRGVLATAHVTAAAPATLGLTFAAPPDPPLTPPLRAVFNLLTVSRGKTVAAEILGSGDASVPGQEFVLQNAPLTYLRDSAAKRGYSSTLSVQVDQVLWTEADSFSGQGPKARVFVTQEDEQHQTHVLFGDGVHGARLTTGVNNVVATYRYGSGADAPEAGTLTTILHPQPNLKAVLNPVPMTGGADPDPAHTVKTQAVQAVMTLGRAVSLKDYEAVAAQAPGVIFAQAVRAWNDAARQMVVTVYVGDDDNAVNAARGALAGVADSNQPLVVTRAKPVPVAVQVVVPGSPAALPSLTASLRAALRHHWTTAALSHSHVQAVLLRVAGITEIVTLTVIVGGRLLPLHRRHSLRPGEFYSLRSEDVEVVLYAG